MFFPSGRKSRSTEWFHGKFEGEWYRKCCDMCEPLLKKKKTEICFSDKFCFLPKKRAFLFFFPDPTPVLLFFFSIFPLLFLSLLRHKNVSNLPEMMHYSQLSLVMCAGCVFLWLYFSNFSNSARKC